MARTRIKICGVCRVEDALAAARAGADAVGMVLVPGARRAVTPTAAAAIVNAMPPFVTPVGLFVDADVADIMAAAKELGIRDIQLHGHEPPEIVAKLRPLRVYKALRVDPTSFEMELSRWREAIRTQGLSNLCGLVLESAGPSGGSGVENDWPAIARQQQAGHLVGLPPIIAAGGLNPNNVGDVVRTLRPWAVDVSTGVEVVLREKSPRKIAQFIAAVRGADPSPV